MNWVIFTVLAAFFQNLRTSLQKRLNKNLSLVDRDRDGRTVLRRQPFHPGLRQEHAGLHHGDGARQPAGRDGVRRDDPRGLPARPDRRQARHHLRL